MKQITLNIADNKFRTFLAFIETLDYVKIEDRTLEELQNSLKQVKLMQEGKLPKQSAKDFLNEL